MPNTIPAAGEAMPIETSKSPRLDESLSFVASNNGKGGGYNHWANVSTGASYAEDCAIGRTLAEEFMAFSGKYPNLGDSCLLGSIMLAMEENGATRGHKIGFMNTINKFAMVGAYVDAKGDKLLEPEMPVDKVERLSRGLSDALVEWTGGSYMAMVYPEGDGRGFWFRHISHGESSSDALGRLRSLMEEAGTILVKHHELNIDRIAVNEIGVHTFMKVPGVSRGPVDPLLAKIQEFQSGLARLQTVKGTITTENEERLVAETYGPSLDELYEWDAPAVTLEGAIGALKIMEQQDVVNDPLGEAMIRAVLSFLEGAKA